MSFFQAGDRVVFAEKGYPLTGKRGTVKYGTSPDRIPFAITVEFDEGLGISTWRASYLQPICDTPSSVPPACGAV